MATIEAVPGFVMLTSPRGAVGWIRAADIIIVRPVHPDEREDPDANTPDEGGAALAIRGWNEPSFVTESPECVMGRLREAVA